MDSQPTFFDSERMPMGDSIELTIRSLETHAVGYPHWAIAYSGGKDSTTLLTLVLHLLNVGRLPRPERLTVLYADTRLELPPLQSAALEMIARLQGDRIDARIVTAEMDKRFLVYMLGRGVPPPN